MKKREVMMEQISNKTLTFLLVVAVVVSIGSTIISINRLNQLIPRITGLAQTTTGIVNISLASINSISITDPQIDYGSCTPNGSYGANLSSNISNSTDHQSWGSPGVCNLFTNNPDNITIKNDGNTYANITLKTNINASDFIGGTIPHGAELYFSVRNASDYPGCNNVTEHSFNPPTNFDGAKGMPWNWTNITTTEEEYLVCANLTPTTDYHTIYVFTKIFLPSDAPQATGTNATLTFTATNW